MRGSLLDGALAKPWLLEIWTEDLNTDSERASQDQLLILVVRGLSRRVAPNPYFDCWLTQPSSAEAARGQCRLGVVEVGHHAQIVQK